jgi:hypothetical protein
MGICVRVREGRVVGSERRMGEEGWGGGGVGGGGGCLVLLPLGTISHDSHVSEKLLPNGLLHATSIGHGEKHSLRTRSAASFSVNII